MFTFPPDIEATGPLVLLPCPVSSGPLTGGSWRQQVCDRAQALYNWCIIDIGEATKWPLPPADIRLAARSSAPHLTLDTRRRGPPAGLIGVRLKRTNKTKQNKQNEEIMNIKNGKCRQNAVLGRSVRVPEEC